MLHAARDPETGTAFSRQELRDQTATMIVGANETTSLALFWSLYLLAMAPAEQERVADEVRGLSLLPEHAARHCPSSRTRVPWSTRRCGSSPPYGPSRIARVALGTLTIPARRDHHDLALDSAPSS